MARSLAAIKAQLAKIDEQKKALVAAERVAQRETVYEVGKLVAENPAYLSSAGMAVVKKHFPEFLPPKLEVKSDFQQLQVSGSQEKIS